MSGTGSDRVFPDSDYLGDGAEFLKRIDDIIDRIALFAEFDRSDVTGIARQMQCYRVPPGREIIREGEQGEFMLLVLAGNIEIVKRGSGGLPQRIAIVGPGETLGEMSLVDGEPRFASCVTVDEVTFAVLDRDGLDQIFDHEPHLGIKMLRELLKLLNQRLRDTGQRLVEIMER